MIYKISRPDPRTKEDLLTIEAREKFDSTKLSKYQDCPRGYLLTYELGLRSQSSDKFALEWGSAVHEGIEHLYNNGFTKEQADVAYEIALNYLLNSGVDLGHSKKNLTSLQATFYEYIAEYPNELLHNTVLETEMGAVIPLDPETDDLFYLKMDTVLQDNITGRICSIDHKTSSWYASMWEKQWKTAFQPFTYNLAMRILYSPEIPTQVIMNGILYSKKDTPTFHRVVTNRDPLQALSFIKYWISRIREDRKIFFNTGPEENYLRAFPIGSACKFCPHGDLCFHKNPVQLLQKPPMAYEIEYWDPERADIKTPEECQKKLQKP